MCRYVYWIISHTVAIFTVIIGYMLMVAEVLCNFGSLDVIGSVESNIGELLLDRYSLYKLTNMAS
jgi:hypothetical protein